VAFLGAAAQIRAIAISDRTWYGRVLVERVEGFCTETEWRRAYREINGM
jgi:polyphosphate kinase 2 (PPK2 family)